MLTAEVIRERRRLKEISNLLYDIRYTQEIQLQDERACQSHPRDVRIAERPT